MADFQEEPKQTKLVAATELEVPQASPWSLAQFYTEEELEAKAEEQAAQAVEQARLTQEEEEKLRQKAKEEGFQAGHDEGYQAGLAQALEEGRQKQEALFEQSAVQMKTLLEAFETPLKTLEEEVFQQMVALSLEVAERVVHQQIRLSDTWIVEVFQRAIEQLPELEAEIEVFVSAEDYAHLHDYLDAQTEHFSAGWRLLQDPHLEKGCLRLKHQNSMVDADWREQLSEVVSKVWQEASAQAYASDKTEEIHANT